MKSLQDQLLKAGLVDKDKARKVSKDKHKQEKTARKSGAKTDPGAQVDTNAMKARHAERDRELNRQKREQAEIKAVAAQIRQLIKMNQVDGDDGDIAYNFVYQNKVKKLQVSEAVRADLGRGRLAIVRLEEGKTTSFRLVPVAVANKIAQRDESVVVHVADDTEARDDGADSDDPYADFKVPDDLMW